MEQRNQLRILATIPSGFCFGLQHITVDFFSRFPDTIKTHFLLTRWSNGDMEKLLKKNNILYSFSWLGMFSRKMDWFNLKMSLHALLKLPILYYDFLKIQRRFKPDVLYFANHHELILLYPVLLFTKKKVICHMHDPSPAIPFQKKTFSKYNKVVDHYIAVSESTRNRTIELGCDPDKISTIYNGISIPANARLGRNNNIANAAGWNESVFIVGITGQMTEKKGHMDLLEAFKIAHSNNPSIRLAIGGKKEEPLYSMLINKLKEWKLNELVFFTGWVDNVNDFFANIDVFVLASRHEEGYGLVVAEAMANYLPVIITASGGAVEIINNSDSGFIVPKQNIEAMSDILLKLSFEPELCAITGKRAHDKVASYFNIEHQSEQLADQLYKIVKE